MDSNTLIIILSTGFIILIVFVCVALAAMIKIMLDIKKITEIARRESEEISELVDLVGLGLKSFFTNSFIMDKIIPAILGAITVGMGAKAAAEGSKYGSPKRKTKKKGRSYVIDGDDIFVREEV